MQTSNKSFNKFMILWSGSFISAIGSGLTAFGLGVYIYQQTASVTSMSLVTLLAFLPALLLSAPAGVLADRYDRRLLMIAGDGLSIIGLLFILWCITNGGAQLWQICVGVSISAVFSSLIEPAYKATVTDMLAPEQYSKASGLMQLSGAAKYLISPVLAGWLLIVADIQLLLILDICTIFVTVATTLTVRQQLQPVSTSISSTAGIIQDIRSALTELVANKGVLALTLMGLLITFSLGMLQTLAAPMILSFSNSAVLGTLMSIIASGMLVTGIVLAGVTIRFSYVKMLSASLFIAGIFMSLFGLRENILIIGVAGFLFFATLPLVNASIDFLIRTNIDNNVQGRIWGLIGLISQLGYILSYALSGVLADYLFTPLLLADGLLTNTMIGRVIGTGAGRGIGLLIVLSGLLLSSTAIIISKLQSIKHLELTSHKTQ